MRNQDHRAGASFPRHRSGHLVGLAVLGLLACSNPEPPTEDLMPVAALEEIPPAEAARAEGPPEVVATDSSGPWRELLEATERSNARLEERVVRLEAELQEARSEARRYRDGVERCVDELNRTAGSPPAGRAAPPRPRREVRARVSTLGTPRVQILADGDVLVTGRLWNSADVDARGQLHLELLVDGRTIAQGSESLVVSARTDVAYAHRFASAGRDEGVYSAWVTLDY